MASYIIRRLLLLIPTVFFALSFLFVLFFMLPGDPAQQIAGGDRAIRPEQLEIINNRYHLDDPLPEQFVAYWERTIQWDLGESFKDRRSVNDILGEKAINSVRLGFWAIMIEIVVGVSVGLWSAIRKYSLTDKMTTVITAGLSAIPVFVLGYLLQYSFAVLPGPNRWQWPEWAGLRTSGLGPNTWTLLVIPTGEQWRYLVLPAVTLACVSTALCARMMRGSMLDVLRADYMRTARAKGLPERSVVLRHGMRNALIPVVTLIAIDFGTVIGAAILTETVFSWPGLGSTIADSVQDRNLPVLLGLTGVVVVAFAVVNLIVDVSYAWFDPRHPTRTGPGAMSYFDPGGSAKSDEFTPSGLDTEPAGGLVAGGTDHGHLDVGGVDASGAAIAMIGEAGIVDVAAARPLRKDVWKRFKRNRLALIGLTFLIFLVLIAIFAPLITSYEYSQLSSESREPPSTDHWFGTDRIGRDVFTRVVYGARISLRIGILATMISLFIGVILGATSGFFGGRTDSLVMRITDILLAIPYIVLAIVIATLFGRSENSVILVLGLTGWLAITRVVRASFLSLRQTEYVEAATSLGYSRRRIMFRHILPNALQPIIVYGTIAVGTVILAEAALSFLGVGPQDPTPAWGLMVSDAGAGAVSTGAHMVFFPGMAIFLTVLAFVFVGDGLRDALDPRLK